MHLYNSYTRQKETFESITPGYVGLYVCGPTVNGESHLGHARPYVTFDVVNRWLQHLGYKVRYVRNITDAGHFEENDRTDNDRIGEKAKLEKLEPMELVHKYTSIFHRLMAAFNNLEPSIEPTATGHITEQIAMIEKIIEEGYAYEVNGSVYFDVKRYAAKYPYGTLSGRILDDLLETTRELEGQDEKREKVDFALWKAAPPQHIQRWPSPWGEGFPGWHIECSAMSAKYLGDAFDIHGGGMDLQFPHHESEIAQSTIAHGHAPARYWMHNNMITINGKKMGRSYNNIIKLTELFSGNHPLLEQGYHPMVVRFNILQTHYRSTLDFSNEALQASERALKRLWEAYEVLKTLSSGTAAGSMDAEIGARLTELSDFMNDDFNTAKVIATLFDLAPVINGLKGGQVPAEALSGSTLAQLQSTFQLFLEDVLGLQPMTQTENTEALSKVLSVLIDIRKEAKLRKDFATSDAIRNQLQAAGILLKDAKDGTVTYTLETH
jgi:cysteinyl-tRNA synthetase